MSKEHGSQKHENKLTLEQKQAKEDVDKIRPILEKDPDWPLVSGIQKPNTQEEYNKENRAQTRLTKKAVQLLYPDYKVSSTHGTGTAHYWVYVDITIPERLEYSEERKIVGRTDAMLEQVGIKYGGYFSDSLPGKDTWTSCLRIEINVAR
ncbi:MAG TPA: hypothetical protein VKC54_04305 [Patescibacteria group bacterium]|nr:hypothetical protein [Patescibacteria group bacterium]